MRTKITVWGNPDTGQVFYGLKAYRAGQWMNVAENGEALLYSSRAAAEAKRADVRCWKEPTNATQGDAMIFERRQDDSNGVYCYMHDRLAGSMDVKGHCAAGIAVFRSL